MPTIKGILTFMSLTNFVISWVEHGIWMTPVPGVLFQYVSTTRCVAMEVMRNVMTTANVYVMSVIYEIYLAHAGTVSS